MNINPLSVVKLVASGVVGIGTGKIVGKIIRDHVQPETVIDKVTVTAAAWVIAGIATRATKEYTNVTIDETVETVKDHIKNIKLYEKVARINTGNSTFLKEGLHPDLFEKNKKNKWVPVKDYFDKLDAILKADEEYVKNAVENATPLDK